MPQVKGLIPNYESIRPMGGWWEGDFYKVIFVPCSLKYAPEADVYFTGKGFTVLNRCIERL